MSSGITRRDRSAAPTKSRESGWERRSAKMPGTRMFARPWSKPGPRSCWFRTVRPIAGASTTNGWVTWSRGSWKPGFRSPISTWLADRTTRYLTGDPSYSTREGISASSCHSWRKPSCRWSFGERKRGGAPQQANARTWLTAGNSTTGSWSSRSGTTSARADSAKFFSASRAGSTRHSSRQLRPMRLVRRNVRCVLLPSKFTSNASRDDALAVAERLGCRIDVVPIADGVEVIDETLSELFAGRQPDITEENIQSRLRGLLLMAMSNKFGEMLLSTGNKSEVAVGYATIYGDMAGGYNPIKDLYKTGVFETCRWRNRNHRAWMSGPAGPVIPDRIMEKPPSAELRPDQTDQDSLPPYDVLDDILERLVEGDASVAECVEAGHDRETVRMVEALVYASEYKRHQSAPGARLSKRAFWLDRRYPIQNRWRDRS